MIPYGRRLKFAFRTFFSILDHSRIPPDVVDALVEPREAPRAAPPPPPAADPSDRALQMLAILQRDGRLIDFLMEDLGTFSDAQIGAAVRDVHSGCRSALDRYLTLGPVIDDEEGRPVTVSADADPAAVKVVGNVAGRPPFQGILRHRGWDVSRAALPPLPASGRSILAPAEVEVS